MKAYRSSVAVGLFLMSTVVTAQAPGAARCAGNPVDAWEHAREAVKSGDAGRVMLALTPAKRARESSSYAVGAHMVLGLSEIAGDLSKKPDVARKAKAAEKKLSLELDGILKKHKAPSIRQIGTPLLARVYSPEVLKRFANVDHAAFARDMEKFFVKVEAAAKDAGVSSEGPPALDELVVGGGPDLNAELSALPGEGDVARVLAGGTVVSFRMVKGCWLIDASEKKKG